MPKVLIGLKKLLPTAQKTGHWRPRSRARASWSGELVGGKSTSRAGTPMKDWVIALPAVSWVLSRGLVSEKGRSRSLTHENEGACNCCARDCFGGGLHGHRVAVLDLEKAPRLCRPQDVRILDQSLHRLATSCTAKAYSVSRHYVIFTGGHHLSRRRPGKPLLGRLPCSQLLFKQTSKLREAGRE
jgi:hypothetical protein